MKFYELRRKLDNMHVTIILEGEKIKKFNALMDNKYDELNVYSIKANFIDGALEIALG